MSISIFSGATTSNKVDESVSFDPNRLFDALLTKLHLKNDATLSCLLGVVPSQERRRSMGLCGVKSRTWDADKC
ncbi:hypothetical protein [Glaciimonas soli]|uniref:Uncharacterized protein n=1 Tax=Glaciimonas soli TaxID=2590999 RepID=A0A843YUH0_9BURK|nr:hypothetical protein [Glaciimonas soli]MQR00971.1 hypothetical protein [Glaciimonas soli]